MHDNSKRVVIIKDIKSNFIEEAILILKNHNGNIKGKNNHTYPTYNIKNSDNIVREAQSIIDKYINECSVKYGYTSPAPQNAKKVRNKKVPIGVMLNIALFISIALFIFLLSRAI